MERAERGREARLARAVRGGRELAERRAARGQARRVAELGPDPAPRGSVGDGDERGPRRALGPPLREDAPRRVRERDGRRGREPPAWNSHLQPDFNVLVIDSFDARLSAVLRELDESNRFVQESAESTSM